MKARQHPDYKRLIVSTRWRKLRQEWITRHPLCERCKEEGRTVAATEVHHTVPVLKGSSAMERERLAYDPANLQSLCRNCHRLAHIALMSRDPEERKARAAKEAEGFWATVRARAPGGVFAQGGGASEISPPTSENARDDF